MANKKVHSQFNNSDVSVVEQTILYSGFYTLSKYAFTHALYKGGTSPLIEREIIERCHAVAVLPYDPVAEAFVLIEQIRIGAMATADSPWLLECIAGMIEPGEDRHQVCVRESQEEAGLTLSGLIPMLDYLVSPGASTERLYVYLAIVDSTAAGGIHGLPEEGEDIMVKVISEQDIKQDMRNNRIDNAACLIALQNFFLNKSDYMAQHNKRDSHE